MKTQNIRMVLVAAASLAVGSWLTGVFAQQDKSAPVPGPATAPAVAPTTAPISAPAPAAPASQPAAPDEASAGVDLAVEPAAAPATVPAAAIPSTLPADVAAVSPEGVPAADPATGPASRPSRFGVSSSRYGKSGSRESDNRSEPTTRPVTPEAVAVAIPPSKAIDKKYEVLLSRSLFSKERPKMPGPTIVKSDPVKPPPPPLPPAPEKSMAVRGMSIEGDGDEDDACYAFIEDLPLKTMKRVKVGDKVARGTIIEVTLSDLVYEYDGKRTRVAIGHTLDGAPAPAITWTTYTPVASAPPPGSRSGDSRGGDSRGGDSRGGDSRGGDSRDRSGDRGSSNGPPVATPEGGMAAPAVTGTPAPAPTPAPAAVTPAAGTPAAGTPAPAAGTPAPADDLLERMRKRREQESGK